MKHIRAELVLKQDSLKPNGTLHNIEDVSYHIEVFEPEETNSEDQITEEWRNFQAEIQSGRIIAIN